MSDTPVVSEREKRTCHVCRRRRKPEAMDGTRCADRESCLRAMGRRVSAAGLTGAELSANAERRKAWRT